MTKKANELPELLKVICKVQVSIFSTSQVIATLRRNYHGISLTYKTLSTFG